MVGHHLSEILPCVSIGALLIYIECPFGNYLDDSSCKCVPWFDHQPEGAIV